MRYLLSSVAFGLLLLTSCARNAESLLEGKWVSQHETDYAYWEKGTFNHAYEPLPIVGKFLMEITPDSIVLLDTKSVPHYRAQHNAYTRQDTMLVLQGGQQMQITELHPNTLSLLLEGATSKYGRVDVEYTFTRLGSAGQSPDAAP